MQSVVLPPKLGLSLYEGRRQYNSHYCRRFVLSVYCAPRPVSVAPDKLRKKKKSKKDKKHRKAVNEEDSPELEADVDSTGRRRSLRDRMAALSGGAAAHHMLTAGERCCISTR